ncbi:MAG: 2-oxoglutarate and iron-dependent oxygenase domain-containing protein, partial [Pseudomonadota bacterium]
MTYATAKTLDADLIPVIDITALRDGSAPDAVAAALHDASQGLGFIYITGHGIPADTIADARRAAFDFFRARDAEKESVLISKSHRGWLKPGAAKMQDDAKVDLKESFIWGWAPEAGGPSDDHPLRGDNQWPRFVPDLEARATAYFEAAHEVDYHLMRGF